MAEFDGKPVIVVTSDGTPVSIGRFVVIRAASANEVSRLELWFDTEQMSCRLRVNAGKLAVIEESWDGEGYRYQLPAGNAVWAKM